MVEYNGYLPKPVERSQKSKEIEIALGNIIKNSSIKYLGDNIFKIDMVAITCSGANVTTIFNVPYMHELIRMDTKHTDSADADSADALNYSLSHRHFLKLWMLYIAVVGETASDIIDEYEDYPVEAGEYKLISNSTNTDLLYISLYLQMKET